eukprot:CCRYP_000037-RA/>CCRYP_000037-RA protein AED:0.01 eAED:0.01 QI:110/1/1/1/1/1/2/1659/1694
MKYNSIDENSGPSMNKMPSPYDKLYDGVNLPAKNEVAAAIAAVRSRGQAGNSLTPLHGAGSMISPASGLKGPMSSRSVESASSPGSADGGPTLFHQSSSKVQSFSFGSDITDSSAGSAPHLDRLSPTFNTGVTSPNTAKRIASSAMAQLRARRIINESRNKQAAAAATTTTTTTTTIPLTPNSDDDSDASTDFSSLINVDPKTIAQVSNFIDSLQKKKGAASTASPTSASGAGLPPKSPRNPASPAGSRYPSLANAKNLMASSQVSQGRKPSHSLHVATDFDEDRVEKSAASTVVNEPTPRRRNVTAGSLVTPSRKLNTPSRPSVTNPSSGKNQKPTSTTVVPSKIDLPTPKAAAASETPVSNNQIPYLPHDDISDGNSSFDDGVSTDDSSSACDVNDSTRRNVAKFIDSLNNKSNRGNEIDTGPLRKKMTLVQEQTNNSADVHGSTAAVGIEKLSNSIGVHPETEEELDNFIASMTSMEEIQSSIPTPRFVEGEHSKMAWTEDGHAAFAEPTVENRALVNENPQGDVVTVTSPKIPKEGLYPAVSVFTNEIKRGGGVSPKVLKKGSNAEMPIVINEIRHGVGASPKNLKEGSNVGVSLVTNDRKHGVGASPKSDAVKQCDVIPSPVFSDKGSNVGVYGFTCDNQRNVAVASPENNAEISVLNNVVESNVIASPKALDAPKAQTPVSNRFFQHDATVSSPMVEDANVASPQPQAKEASNTELSFVAESVESYVDVALYDVSKDAPKTVASQLNDEAAYKLAISLPPPVRPATELNILIPTPPVETEAIAISIADDQRTSAGPISPSKSISSAIKVKPRATPTSRDENKSKSPTSLASPVTTPKISASPSSQVDNNKHSSYEESLACISEQIKQVVRSEVPSLTLGKVLAEANRRGITLDIVTEIYKQERFKVSSEKIAKWEAEARSYGQSKSSKDDSSVSKVQSSTTKDSFIGSQSDTTTDNLQKLPSPSSKGNPPTPGSNKMGSSAQIPSPLKVESVSSLMQASPSPSVGRAAGAATTTTPSHTKIDTKPEALHVKAESSNAKVSTSQERKSIVVDTAEDPASSSIAANRIASPCVKTPSNRSTAVSQADDHAAAPCLKLPGKKYIEKRNTANSPDVKSPDHRTTSSRSHSDPLFGDKKGEVGILDGIIAKIKASVRSDNPSEEFGKILAGAKANGIPINPLVELYTKERMALSSFPSQNGDFPLKDIVVSRTSADTIEQSDDNIVQCHSDLSTQQGLSEAQLLQLQQLINTSQETKESGYYQDEYPDGNIESSHDPHLEDIDAFFSRFSIDVGQHKAAEDSMQLEPVRENLMEDKTTVVRSSESVVHGSNKGKSQTWFESKQSQNVVDYDYAELEPQDSSLFSERGHVAEVRTLNNGVGTVLYMQDSSLEIEFVEPIESMQLSVPKKEKKKKRIKEKKKKIIKLNPRDNRRVVVLRDDLPGYSGYWKSPWERNRARQSSVWGSSRKDGINGVDAAARCARRRGSMRQRHCFLPEKERTKGHPGYRYIDFYSLYEATNVKVEDQEIDSVPWECRDVRQRFLHEKSVESRNWFGSFEMNRGNDRIHHPVALPKSLELTVTRIPDPEEWNENWYTTWRSRRDNPNNLIAFAEYEITTGNESNDIGQTSSSLDESEQVTHRSGGTRRKVAIEIGSLCPVRLKAGERISRIHPDYTSSLRSSRWRKKYLSGVQFPGS